MKKNCSLIFILLFLLVIIGVAAPLFNKHYAGSPRSTSPSFRFNIDDMDSARKTFSGSSLQNGLVVVEFFTESLDMDHDIGEYEVVSVFRRKSDGDEREMSQAQLNQFLVDHVESGGELCLAASYLLRNMR